MSVARQQMPTMRKRSRDSDVDDRFVETYSQHVSADAARESYQPVASSSFAAELLQRQHARYHEV